MNLELFSKKMNFQQDQKPMYADHIPLAQVVEGVVAECVEPAYNLPMVRNVPNLRNYLNDHGWPNGLQEYFISSLDRIPIRYFICDDSGSMSTEDGNRIISYNGTKRFASSL